MAFRNPFTGKFMSKKDYEALIARHQDLQKQIKELDKTVEKFIEENAKQDRFVEALRDVIVGAAFALGITPDEFKERVEIVHPTQQDPVLLIDGKPMVSWV
jgi:uncharacterized protein YhaN